MIDIGMWIHNEKQGYDAIVSEYEAYRKDKRRSHLETIQKIVNHIGKQFILKLEPENGGAPYTIEFNPDDDGRERKTDGGIIIPGKR